MWRTPEGPPRRTEDPAKTKARNKFKEYLGEKLETFLSGKEKRVFLFEHNPIANSSLKGSSQETMPLNSNEIQSAVDQFAREKLGYRVNQEQQTNIADSPQGNIAVVEYSYPTRFRKVSFVKQTWIGPDPKDPDYGRKSYRRRYFLRRKPEVKGNNVVQIEELLQKQKKFTILPQTSPPTYPLPTPSVVEHGVTYYHGKTAGEIAGNVESPHREEPAPVVTTEDSPPEVPYQATTKKSGSTYTIEDPYGRVLRIHPDINFIPIAAEQTNFLSSLPSNERPHHLDETPDGKITFIYPEKDKAYIEALRQPLKPPHALAPQELADYIGEKLEQAIKKYPHTLYQQEQPRGGRTYAERHREQEKVIPKEDVLLLHVYHPASQTPTSQSERLGVTMIDGEEKELDSQTLPQASTILATKLGLPLTNPENFDVSHRYESTVCGEKHPFSWTTEKEYCLRDYPGFAFVEQQQYNRVYVFGKPVMGGTPVLTRTSFVLRRISPVAAQIPEDTIGNIITIIIADAPLTPGSSPTHPT